MIPQPQSALQIEQNEGEGEIDASLIMPKELIELYGMSQRVQIQKQVESDKKTGLET